MNLKSKYLPTIGLPVLCCALALPLACASAKPPAELVHARQAYVVAEVNATHAAPVELHDARLALNLAEATFRDAPKSDEVRDLAYIAQRRSEVASARAAVFMSNQRRDASNVKLRSLGSQAASDLRDTKDDLSASEQKARASARDVSGLKSELKDSESNAAVLATQLAAEKQARHDAEVKLTSTLQAMRDLQSVREEPRGLVITLSGAVMFASGQSVLLPAARAALNNVAEALKATPDRAISVEGHTDSQGSPSSNMELSQHRGDAVRSYLVSRGIVSTTIQSTGFGQERPIADNMTAEGRANNRRVEIVLAPAPPEAR